MTQLVKTCIRDSSIELDLIIDAEGLVHPSMFHIAVEHFTHVPLVTRIDFVYVSVLYKSVIRYLALIRRNNAPY